MPIHFAVMVFYLYKHIIDSYYASSKIFMKSNDEF